MSSPAEIISFFLIVDSGGSSSSLSDPLSVRCINEALKPIVFVQLRANNNEQTFGNNVQYVPPSSVSLSLSAPSSEGNDLSVFLNHMSLTGTYSTVNRIFHICQFRLSNIQINCYLIIRALLDLLYVTRYKNLEKYIKIGVLLRKTFWKSILLSANLGKKITC